MEWVYIMIGGGAAAALGYCFGLIHGYNRAQPKRDRTGRFQKKG